MLPPPFIFPPLKLARPASTIPVLILKNVSICIPSAGATTGASYPAFTAFSRTFAAYLLISIMVALSNYFKLLNFFLKKFHFH